MSDFVEQVLHWQRTQRPVSLVRVISTAGFSTRERAALIAFTPGEAPAGSMFSGALDARLHERLDADPKLRSVLEMKLSDEDAADAGLSCGGSARLLAQPATDIDEAGWAALGSGEPVCLITELSDATVGVSAVFTAATIDEGETRFGPGVRRIFTRGTDQTAQLDTAVVTSLWPVPSLIIVGGGQIAAALIAAAELLEWATHVVDDPDAAIGAIAGLTHADAVVVLSHDPETGGRALLTALAGGPGYVGGLGSNHTQVARATWLIEHGVNETDVARIHGPAGLDLGAFTPAEIAAAITAEIIAVRSGASGGFLRGRTGPVRSV